MTKISYSYLFFLTLILGDNIWLILHVGPGVDNHPESITKTTNTFFLTLILGDNIWLILHVGPGVDNHPESITKTTNTCNSRCVEQYVICYTPNSVYSAAIIFKFSVF